MREQYVESLRLLDWTPDTVFYAPVYPGIPMVDEGSPFLWWYFLGASWYMVGHLQFAMPERAGFLVCWPMGTRLRIQTHPTVQVHTWWLDPAIEVGIVEEAAA